MRKAQSRLPQRPSSSISGLLMPALEAHTGESHATARISTSTAGTQSGLLNTVSGPAGTLAVNSPTDSTAPPRIRNTAADTLSSSATALGLPPPQKLSLCWMKL